MKTAKKITEHFLLPLNLAFLSFIGLFLIYELDKYLGMDSPIQASYTSLVMIGSSVCFLIGAIKFRNAYFQTFCLILAIIALGSLI